MMMCLTTLSFIAFNNTRGQWVKYKDAKLVTYEAFKDIEKQCIYQLNSTSLQKPRAWIPRNEDKNLSLIVSLNWLNRVLPSEGKHFQFDL